MGDEWTLFNPKAKSYCSLLVGKDQNCFLIETGCEVRTYHIYAELS